MSKNAEDFFFSLARKIKEPIISKTSRPIMTKVTAPGRSPDQVSPRATDPIKTLSAKGSRNAPKSD
jgi:hypothetical protein